MIHVERLWAENVHTAEGRVLHEKADEGRPDSRGGVRTLRAVQIASSSLHVHGVSDIVEIHGCVPYPIEYKRGRPKAHRADEVQLCAQALCLEEMMDEDVAEGALFYGKRRRRTTVAIDLELRELTALVAAEASASIFDGKLPLPVYDSGRCDTCSMKDLCRPLATRKIGSEWLSTRISNSGVPE